MECAALYSVLGVWLLPDSLWGRLKPSGGQVWSRALFFVPGPRLIYKWFRLMKKKEVVITRTFLEGEWEWKDVSAGTHWGWFPLTEFGKNEHIWCFRADGIMMSERDSRIVYLVRYSFRPRDRVLYLEGLELGPDGQPSVRVNEKYRVKIRSRNEIYLYDLEDVTVEPDEYSLRLCFKRIVFS